MNRSLRIRLALMLSVFVVVLIVFPLMANNFFGAQYYLKNKMTVLENTYLTIEAEYGEMEDFNELIDNIKQWEIDRGLRFTIANANFRTVYTLSLIHI